MDNYLAELAKCRQICLEAIMKENISYEAGKAKAAIARTELEKIDELIDQVMVKGRKPQTPTNEEGN